MKITHNLAQVRKQMALANKQVRFAGMRALNTVAFMARSDLQQEMRRVFDRPTPYVLRAVQVEMAQRDKLQADIYLRYPGGKGVDPNSVLQAEIEGGRRNDKRMERALQRLGVLTTSWQVVPGKGMPPEKMDQYGNVKGSFIVQLISYFGAFGEQGYRANMTAKRKATLAKRKRTDSGFVEIRGVQYFISRGRGTFAGRGVQRMGEHAGDRRRQEQHLPPGIWSRSGIHGSIVKPIFMFVRRPVYVQRLRFDEVVRQTAQDNLQPILEWYVQDALNSAR